MNGFIKLLLLSSLFVQCQISGAQKIESSHEINSSYWDQGLAEINVYELQQNRYNEIHPGNLISIYVAEDFLTEKQVKNESFLSSKSTRVLKNIQTRRFKTGVYEYQLFNSIFTPFDQKTFPGSLKLTNSSQEWCGTSFLQMNRKAKSVKVKQFSYFESEGDQDFSIKVDYVEDDLFNLIRLNPSLLPVGSFQIIPNANYLRLKHKEIKAYQAMASVDEYKGEEFLGEKLKKYTLSIEGLPKQLEIIFETVYPYKIVAWTESYPSAFDGKMRTTKAVLKKTTMIDYWSKNQLKDSVLRKELGLE